jgi:hypothetical protein
MDRKSKGAGAGGKVNASSVADVRVSAGACSEGSLKRDVL